MLSSVNYVHYIFDCYGGFRNIRRNYDLRIGIKVIEGFWYNPGTEGKTRIDTFEK